MTLGNVLKKERERIGLSFDETAKKLGISAEKYGLIEGGKSPAEEWGPRLARIAMEFQLPVSRLLSKSGKSYDCKPGQTGSLIKMVRELRGWSIERMISMILKDSSGSVRISPDEFNSIEEGNSPLEEYGPLLLRFAELIDQSMFNLFYPTGIFFREIDDYD